MLRTMTEFSIPFAGAGLVYTPDSILSHCSGALLPMFTTKEATVLRQLCKEFKDTVADFPWEDETTVIRGGFEGWRASFPMARRARKLTRVLAMDRVYFYGVQLSVVFVSFYPSFRATAIPTAIPFLTPTNSFTPFHAPSPNYAYLALVSLSRLQVMAVTFVVWMSGPLGTPLAPLVPCKIQLRTLYPYSSHSLLL